VVPLLGTERALPLVEGRDGAKGGRPRVPPTWGVPVGPTSLLGI
jgi:hypothetical protein